MSQQPLYVSFVWHMHQPYYRDLKTNEYLMPWVRLHATKDYLDMPLLAAEYPGIKLTFNMVPSLLEQIEDYAADRADDPYLRLARKPAKDLTEEDRLQLLSLFFQAQYERMIKPYHRYNQLYTRRGWTQDKRELRRTAQTFSATDLRDLQVWFFLCWIDPYLRELDPRLRELVLKDRNFTEQDKLDLVEISRKLVGRIIPTLQTLWAEGRIELSTTPFYHPILPLLVDTNIARRARPRMNLPGARFQHPEDAVQQIRMGLDYCQERFGRRPAGMWPSEGSVCPELIPFFQKEGIRWIATDEEVLAYSLGGEGFWRDKNGMVNNADGLYRPYVVNHGGGETAVFFRDHFLSDLIGFKYAHWNPADAAADLVRRLEEIRAVLRASPEPHVVSIILDGENCWEHYEVDGQPFLRALYHALAGHPGIKTTTPSEYLSLGLKHRILENLHSGSWINHDFGVWIGHPEDNAAWDLLTQARGDIHRRLHDPAVQIDPPRRDLAWKSLLVAEGSDWNWWYGDDHNSGIDDQFDSLYRRHLTNAYDAVGLTPPAALSIPISTGAEIGVHTQPCAFVTPRLDGRITSYYEWFSAGHFDPTRGGDSMHQAESIVRALYFGFDNEKFYLRVDLNESWRAARIVKGTELVVYLFGEANTKIHIPLTTSELRPAATVWREKTGGQWDNEGRHDELGVGAIVEAAFPLDRYRIIPLKMMHFQVAIEVEGRELERCPSRAPFAIRVPGETFEEEMWIV
ncbi:MAG: glycoside hydrolase family 57 protein [bacterium]|nr:glycoside hydrolase family 57 protein [bacterium]